MLALLLMCSSGSGGPNRFGIGIYNDTLAPGVTFQLTEASALVGNGGSVLLDFNLLFSVTGDPSSCEAGCLPAPWQLDAVRQAYTLGLRPVVRLGQWSRRIRDFADGAASGVRTNYTRLAAEYRRFVAALPLPPDGQSALRIQLLNEPNVCGEWSCLGTEPGAHLLAETAAAEVAGCLRDLAAALQSLPRLAIGLAPIAQVGFARCECTAPFQPIVKQNATAVSYVSAMLAAVPELYDTVDALIVHAYPEDWRQGFDTPTGRAGIMSYQPVRDLVEKQRRRPPSRAWTRGNSGWSGAAVSAEKALPSLPIVVGETGWQGPNQTLKAESIVAALTQVFFADPAVTTVLPFMLANSGPYSAMWPWTEWPVNASAPTVRHEEWLAMRALRCQMGVGGAAGCPPE